MPASVECRVLSLANNGIEFQLSQLSNCVVEGGGWWWLGCVRWCSTDLNGNKGLGVYGGCGCGGCWGVYGDVQRILTVIRGVGCVGEFNGS